MELKYDEKKGRHAIAKRLKLSYQTYIEKISVLPEYMLCLI